MAHRCMLVILVLLANVSLLLADQLLEAEKLQLVTPTPGQIERQNLVDIGLAERGQFGADSILLWYDAQKGDVLELKVPVQETARYSITVQLAKSWDYGIHQFVVNGVDSGNPVDLYAAETPGAAGPLERKLPEVNLRAGETILGLRVVGTNPKASPARYAAGIDWIKLEKVGEAPGGGATEQVLEAEKLAVVTPTPGRFTTQNLVQLGLAEHGQFGADSILLWYGAKRGDVLELKVPVQKAARYSITVQLAKSKDCGIHQFVVNGVDSGNPVDLYAAESPGAAGPLQRKLPEVNLPAGETILGLRVVGANPEASRNRFAAGIDWIKLEKVGEISGGGETNPPLIVVPENREDFAGAWLDRERYWLTLVSVDGTWGMMPEADGTTPRAGNWGMPERLHVTFRTCLGRESELWIGGLKARSAHDLLHGPYDLTMVWDLQWQDGLLVGTLRTWQARYSASGEIAEFKSWDDPGNDPLPVTWRPVPQPTPGQDLPRPMPSILRRLPERPDPGVMRNFLDWYLGR